MAQAIETHPKVGSAELAYENALDDVIVARSQRFPQIDLTYSISHEKNPTYMGIPGTLNSKTLGVGGGWTLIDFGVSKNQIQAAHSRAHAVETGVEDQKTVVALSSVEAYISVLRERLSLDLAVAAYRDHTDLYNLLGSGLSETNNDIISARSQSICDSVQSFSQDHIAAKNFYQAVLDYDPENYFLAEPSKAAVEMDVERSLELAVENLPAFSMNLSEQEALSAELESAHRARLPRVSLRGGLQDFNQKSDEFGRSDWDGNYIGVQLSVPLVDGGRRRAKVRQAERSKRKAILERETLWRDVRRQLNDLTQSLKSSVARTAELEGAVQSSRSAIEAMKKDLIKLAGGKKVVDQQVLINVLDERKRLYLVELELNNQKMNSILDSYSLLGRQGLLLQSQP